MSLPDPQTFTALMELTWHRYGNVVSPALRRVWGEIGQTFNRQITSPSLPRPVIAAALGAGKSTCAKVYCSLLPREDHPGVLIVLRTVDQVEEYAREIGETALALHSKLESQPKPEQVL